MATMLAFIAFTAVSSHLAPRLGSRDILFGVTLAPGLRDGPVARMVSRRYVVEIWLLAMIIASLVASSGEVAASVLLTQIFGAAIAFANARHSLLPYAAAAATVREAEIAPRPSLPGGLIGQLGPFAILLIAAIYVGMHGNDFPTRFPTHWNIAGRPNGWTNKSVVGAYNLLWIGLVVCTLTWTTAYAVLHRTRLPRVTGEEGLEHRRARQINLVVMLASEYLVSTLLVWAAVAPLFSEAPERAKLPLALRLAPVVLTLAGMLAITRSRAILRVAAEDGQPVGDATPDSCWVLGWFYFNRADPAVFVQKRMGLGYTPNFGNGWSWLVVILAILAISVPGFLIS